MKTQLYLAYDAPAPTKPFLYDDDMTNYDYTLYSAEQLNAMRKE